MIGKIFIKNLNHQLFFGYGAQGDRFLINQTASNGLIYAISSSGILGLSFYIFFSTLSLWIIFKNFLISFRFNLKINFYIILIILLILLRSILESSYAVFSIDLIVIYTF